MTPEQKQAIIFDALKKVTENESARLNAIAVTMQPTMRKVYPTAIGASGRIND